MGCQPRKIPCNYHHSFLVPVVLGVSQRLNIAASKSQGNITKKIKFHEKIKIKSLSGKSLFFSFFFQSISAHKTSLWFRCVFAMLRIFKNFMCKGFKNVLVYLVKLFIWRHNDVTIVTYKLRPKYCSSLLQLDSIYQNIA